MLAALQPGFERIVRSALLGVQFRDALDGRVVAEGLQVQIQDLWQPSRRLVLTANRSGIFALHAFAGMRGFGDDALDSPPSPPETGRFKLTARDTLGRYLPVSLLPELPDLRGAGLWSPVAAWTSPLNPVPHVPLFSATTRPLPVAMASLRAELRRASQPGQPAPWARLELWLGSTRLAEGQADDGGRALLLFPVPRPREAMLGTSPAGAPPPFEWTVSLRAFWDAANRAGTVPDFDGWMTQPAAALLQSATPALPLPPLLLRAGQTLQAARPPSSYVYVAE